MLIAIENAKDASEQAEDKNHTTGDYLESQRAIPFHAVITRRGPFYRLV
jgi:hypothetical protein